MGDINTKYNLIHLTAGGEYMAPLVASQLFDQAEFQSVTKEGFAPQKVEAWIIGAMRDYYDQRSKEKLLALRKRCPHVTIRMINGIGRLGSFPIMELMKLRRNQLDKSIPTIFHCRGEYAAEWAIKLKKYFPGDKIVVDIRGYWPAEYLYNKGIEDPAAATGDDQANYEKAYAFLKNILSRADAVTTVSTALKELLVKEFNASGDSAVVPCCVSAITPDDKREEIRKGWGVRSDEIVLVYSGTTAAYQHLEDLTIPFMREVAKENPKVRLAFFSSEKEKIQQMLHSAGINIETVLLQSYQQKEVAAALNACDAGILIRKPTLVNRVANPVKIAEYLAAGLPIIIEKGVGGVADELFERSLLKGIALTGGKGMGEEAGAVNNWLSSAIQQKRPLVREYVKKVYLWSAAIHVSRNMYKNALAK